MASTPTSDVKEHRWTTRERPWLVPWNRKLRHLHGIALRNLDLSRSDTRNRRKTNDDDALPNSLKSPAKLLALREIRTLEHSRSSTDLRPINESAISDKSSTDSGVNGSRGDGSKQHKTRPTMAKLRRRSTMDWASGSPQQRQKRLEDVSATRTADVFFTLHVEGVKDAIYVSEVVEKSMDPDFRRIDLDGCGPGITRADSLTIRFWVKSDRMNNYQVLLELSLNLRSLQFIGKDLVAFMHPFPHNCVIFQLTDGFYTCFTDAVVDESTNPFAGQVVRSPSARPLPTASFDALLRLSKLDDSIQDAIALRNRLSGDLERIVAENHESLAEKRHVAELDDFQKTIDYAKATVEKQLRNLRKLKEQKQEGLRSRCELLRKGRAEQDEATTHMATGRAKILEERESQESLRAAIVQQRRRICEDLQKVYPITPVPDRPLAFAIRGLHLPDSEQLDTAQPDTIAGALGHVAHIVQLLSFYLDQPLPYPVNPRSSTSTITDPISLMKPTSSTPNAAPPTTTNQPTIDPSRIFPLFPRGSGPRFRFEYGLFLLNKDIELLLANAFRVRVLDIRQTLPNLLYALYCATAGEGELPARKAGGVRGLLRAGNGVGREDGGGESRERGNGKENEDGTSNGVIGGQGRALGSLARNREVQEKKLRGK